MPYNSPARTLIIKFTHSRKEWKVKKKWLEILGLVALFIACLVAQTHVGNVLFNKYGIPGVSIWQLVGIAFIAGIIVYVIMTVINKTGPKEGGDAAARHTIRWGVIVILTVAFIIAISPPLITWVTHIPLTVVYLIGLKSLLDSIAVGACAAFFWKLPS